MSYYDKKVIKGSSKKDDCWKKEYQCENDHCKKDDHCEKHDWKDECEYEEIVGSVSSGSALTLSVGSSIQTPLPLNSPVYVTECIKIAPSGGLEIQEDGEYFIQFTITLGVVAAGASLQVFAGDRFLGNVSPLLSLNVGKFARIVPLKKGDVVQVLATGAIAVTLLDAGILTVAKVGD